MNYTSIEQSKHLLELGLKPETADCCWVISRDNCKQEPFELAKNESNLWLYPIDKIRSSLSDYMLPCWSTGVLIDLLPKYIRNKCSDYHLLIFCNSTSFDVEYNAKVIAEIGFNRDNLIDALVEMVLWCLEKGYIEKKGE